MPVTLWNSLWSYRHLRDSLFNDTDSKKENVLSNGFIATELMQIDEAGVSDEDSSYRLEQKAPGKLLEQANIDKVSPSASADKNIRLQGTEDIGQVSQITP